MWYRPRTQLQLRVCAVLAGAMSGQVMCESNSDRRSHGQTFPSPSNLSSVKIFSGNANLPLAKEVAMHLGVELGRISVQPYADGETSVKVHDSVRGKDVYIVQPTCTPVNNNLMELLLMITTMRRASAKRITAVIPYFGYGRSSETFARQRRPIAGADVAIMLEVAGVDRVVAVDLHRGQTQGFFSPHIPVDNLDASKIALPYLQTKFLHNLVVLSPDANGTARAKAFADKMMKNGFRSSFAMVVDSKCESDDEELYKDKKKATREYQLMGDVTGKDVVIVDDIIDTGGRMIRTAELVRQNGAARIFAFASHGLFTQGALDKLDQSPIVEVMVLNTIPISPMEPQVKVQQLSVGALVAETIRRIHTKQTLSRLF